MELLKKVNKRDLLKFCELNNVKAENGSILTSVHDKKLILKCIENATIDETKVNEFIQSLEDKKKESKEDVTDKKSKEPKKDKYTLDLEKITDPLEKLKYEFDNSPFNVKVIINEVLYDEISKNEEFAKKYMSKDKTCKKMWKFINDCAKQYLASNSTAISTPTIYSLALHYIEEEKPEYVEEMMQEPTLEYGVKYSSDIVIKYRVEKITNEVIKAVEKTGKKVNQVADAKTLEKVRAEVREELEKEYQAKLYGKDSINKAFQIGFEFFKEEGE